jgi:hypothetical protein
MIRQPHYIDLEEARQVLCRFLDAGRNEALGTLS